jgi:23S rRNA U2552 (ribose-2'-O)-methylase RlmE/FtsJ
MTIVLLVLLIALMMLLMTSRKEMFGYAGYSDPVVQVVIDDPVFDTKEYTESTDVSVTNDLMQELVLATNEYVAKKTGLCTYVIETTSIKKFTHKEHGKDLYRCMFMLMKQHGFVFGFAVTVDIFVTPGGLVQVVSARTQPIDVVPPTDQSPFQSDIEGHVFTDYDLFKKSELDLLKQK